MKLVFEKGSAGGRPDLISPCDVPQVFFEKAHIHEKQPRLPHMLEDEVSRHYTGLAKRSHDVNDGFYPLGSCTMKYNPKVNEEVVALKGFRGVHPLRPEAMVQGSTEVLYLAEKYLYEITGMGTMTFQPAAGAYGEFTGPLLIKAYRVHHNDTKRTEIVAPDSAHGTNPASTFMCGYDVVSTPSREGDYVDLKQLKAAVREGTAGLILINPNIVGLFDKNILGITKTVHDAGGLCHYDSANLNAVIDIARPSDMGPDVVHLNLHKTFSAPHGSSGSGSGPVGCKEILKSFIPGVRVEREENTYYFVKTQDSPGGVKMFYGNFLVVVRALSYILTFGKEGIPETAHNTVLDANCMRVKLSDVHDVACSKTCMHESVMNLERVKHDKDISTTDIAKTLLDYGIYPPTTYSLLIMHEVLMMEPTEIESRGTLGEAIEVPHKIYEQAPADPKALYNAPHLTPIGRPNGVTAACKPVLRYI